MPFGHHRCKFNDNNNHDEDRGDSKDHNHNNDDNKDNDDHVILHPATHASNHIPLPCRILPNPANFNKQYLTRDTELSAPAIHPEHKQPKKTNMSSNKSF